MPECTPSASWLLALTYVLPPVGALLSATALWVASLARTTSKDALLTSAAVARRSDMAPRSRGRRGSPPDVADPKRS